MIPVQLYHNKISSLHDVIQEMGSSPAEIAEWLFADRNISSVALAKMKARGDQSVALVASMPKFQGATLLGMRLTEPLRAKKAHSLLQQNHTALFEEMNEIERIQAALNQLLSQVKLRIGAVRAVHEDLADKSREGGQGASEARHQADHIERSVLPVLYRLRNELDRAIKMCMQEIKVRGDEVEHLDKNALKVPRYNRRARRKRKARAAAKAAAEAAVKDSEKDKGGESS